MAFLLFLSCQKDIDLILAYECSSSLLGTKIIKNKRNTIVSHPNESRQITSRQKKVRFRRNKMAFYHELNIGSMTGDIRPE